MKQPSNPSATLVRPTRSALLTTSLIFIGLTNFNAPAVGQQVGKSLTIPAKRIICPNGNVQFTPCLPAQRQVTQNTTGSIGVVQNTKSKAQVHNTNFHSVGPGQGIWEGFVTGRGLLGLTLSIYSGGQLQETRYIGQVKQDRQDKPTKFTFKSAIPTASDWTWAVAVKNIS